MSQQHGAEPPKKMSRTLDQVLLAWRKNKTKEKEVDDFLKEYKTSLTSTAISENEKVKKFSHFYKTFIKHRTLPDAFKNDVATYIDAEEVVKTEPVSQQTIGKSEETSLAHPMPQASGGSPIISQKDQQKQLKQFEENNSKRELEEARKDIDRLKHLLEDKAKEIENLTKAKAKELEKMTAELKTKEGEVTDFQQRFDNNNKELQVALKEKADAKKELKEKLQCIKDMELHLNKYIDAEMNLKKKIEVMGNVHQAEKESSMKEINELTTKNNELYEECQKFLKREKSQDREIQRLNEQMMFEIRKRDENIDKLIKERDDLRDRFSKVAGAKLSDQNADIADLSDPNRAMKLSERFGQLYDDEWTNAFETLSDVDKKIGLKPKEAIDFLLGLLKECLNFCDMVRDTQTDSLKNVFLHPVQNSKFAATEGIQDVQAMRDKPRVASKEDKILRELRRQIAAHPGVIEEVKKAFVTEAKSWEKEKKGIEKKYVEACIPYLQRCAELCWLIVLHDPPLYVKFDLKQGEKFDPNSYTVYSSSGEKYDFLVWPPLFNGEKGGLLSKGVAEPQRVVKKGK